VAGEKNDGAIFCNVNTSGLPLHSSAAGLALETVQATGAVAPADDIVAKRGFLLYGVGAMK
jgi:hypothetical protein